MRIICFLLLSVVSLSGQPLPEAFRASDFARTVGLREPVPSKRICRDFFEVLAEHDVPPPPLVEGRYYITNEIDLATQLLSPVYNRSVLWVLHFPPGTYELTRQQEILYDNLVIQGEGPGQTHFVANEGIGNCFNVLGRIDEDQAWVVHGQDGQSWFHLYERPEAPAPLLPGQFVFLSRADPAPSCKPASVGQIVQLGNRNGPQWSTTHPLRIDFPSSSAMLQPMRPRRNVGFENSSLDATGRDFESARSQASNFSFQYVVNGWVRGVESVKPPYQHVRIDKSSNIEVSGCHFRDAHRHDGGGGGRGYGINFQNAAGECLIVNNIFEQLRHAIVFQYGSNGNAVAYNYTLNNEPEGDKGLEDLIFHGAYPFRNLVEGNSVEEIEFDLANGWNGPYNLLYRNHVRTKGIRSQSNLSTGCRKWSRTESIAVVGNVTEQCVNLARGDHFEADNISSGDRCDGKEIEKKWPASWMYDERPDFFPAGVPWPQAGSDSENQDLSPAGLRYLSGGATTYWAGEDCLPLGTGAPFRTEVYVDTCRDSGVDGPGKLILWIQGGQGPYDIQWPSQLTPNGDFSAIFTDSGPYQIQVRDRQGQVLNLTGDLPDCIPADFPPFSSHFSAQVPFLASIFPNPSSGPAQIFLWLPSHAQPSIDLFSSTGHFISSISLPQPLAPGHHRIDLPTPTFSTGTIYCRINWNDQVEVLRIVRQ